MISSLVQAEIIAGIGYLLPIVRIVIGIMLDIRIYRDAEKRKTNQTLRLIIGLLVVIVISILLFMLLPPSGGEAGN